ncbi:MAG TPA: hypothetical protein VFP97_12845 [Chitinophagaceae bacterium]|nr:hypothetical protein [Chitinophagaceae bacterium]
MKNIKHLLIFLLLVVATLVIHGGTKSKPCVVVTETRELKEKAALTGFPDMISFTNYINQ